MPDLDSNTSTGLLQLLLDSEYISATTRYQIVKPSSFFLQGNAFSYMRPSLLVMYILLAPRPHGPRSSMVEPETVSRMLERWIVAYPQEQYLWFTCQCQVEFL